MSQDKPNMDEVVRQIKHAVEMREKADIYENRKSTEWLRLLIEEREQLIQTLKIKDDTISTIERGYFFQLDKAAELQNELEQIHAMLTEQIEKRKQSTLHAIEQDKEIQHLRDALREITFGHDSAMHLQIIAEKALN